MIFIAQLEPSTDVCITVEGVSLDSFKELVFRATNLWPDAPPEIKRFADQLIHGQILQDYDSQNRDRRSKKYEHAHRCSCGHVSIFVTNSPESPTYPVKCLNEDVEVERRPSETKGEWIVKTVACNRLEMFNKSPINPHGEK